MDVLEKHDSFVGGLVAIIFPITICGHPKTYVVVQHTATILDGDADNLHDSGSDDGGEDEYKDDL